MTEHVQVGELYLEYLKGDCQKTNKTLGEFCTKLPCSTPGLERVPRPMPDHEALPDLFYLPFDKTPTIFLTGSQREVGDYQPTAQAKKRFQNGTLVLDDAESIKKVCCRGKSFKNLEHLEYIQ